MKKTLDPDQAKQARAVILRVLKLTAKRTTPDELRDSLHRLNDLLKYNGVTPITLKEVKQPEEARPRRELFDDQVDAKMKG